MLKKKESTSLSQGIAGKYVKREAASAPHSRSELNNTHTHTHLTHPRRGSDVKLNNRVASSRAAVTE